MHLSPKALKSWAFQWGKDEPAWASLEDKWQPIPRTCSEQLVSVKECYDYILPHYLSFPCSSIHPTGCVKFFMERKPGLEGQKAFGMPGLVESLERGACTGQVVPPTPLWKMGCSSNVCYGLDTEIAMPDPPGLRYVWNQTRWSFLALKFSYSKILSHFLFSLNGRSISSQSSATSFFQFKRSFFFFSWENSEVISLLWGLLLFVTCSLSCEKRKCLS